MKDKPRLIGITIIKNESQNYLNDWLNEIGKIVDYHIFLDDASTDNTPDVIRNHLQKYPGELHILKQSLFKDNEPLLRSKLWNYARNVARDGDWILIVDADEFYDENLLSLKKKLLKNKYPNIDVVKVSCLDMWNAISYRVDGNWSPKKCDVRLIRYYDVDFGWENKTNLHNPPYPYSTNIKKSLKTYIPKIHLAYLKERDRAKRYNFYINNVSQKDDPISYKHALSIMDELPKLKKYFSITRNMYAGLHRWRIYFRIQKILKQHSKELCFYRKRIKAIINIITFRAVRKKIKNCFLSKTYKKIAKEIDNKLTENSILIFQHQFFDSCGDRCFNGGAERYVSDLSSILKNLGFNVVLLQKSSGGFWEKELDSMRVIGVPSEYTKIISYLTKFHLAIYSGSVFWGKKLLHPNIMIGHGITWDCTNKNTNIDEIANIFMDVDNIVSVDINTISWLRTTFAKTMFKRNMYYVPNYVDTTIYKPKQKNNERIKIIFPRRLSLDRGYWFISAIIPVILNKYDNVDFDFIGFVHGDEILQDLNRLINSFSNRVKHYFVEPDKMVSVYQNADISLIPTQYSEGTSLSCLEAQACGNVVIATNIGGLPNLIINGYNGILINPNYKELLEAIDNVLSNGELMTKLSQNAVAVSKVFDKKIWVERWKNIFSSILQI